MHSDVVITSIKDDNSLFDREVDNADKIKQRRRRSSSKKRRSNLTNVDTTSNSQSFCSMGGMQQRPKTVYNEDGVNRYGRRRSVEYEEDKKIGESNFCALI